MVIAGCLIDDLTFLYSANEAQATANSAAANNLNNKYCNCCYCEFFGNGGPTNAQANRNTKIRERLQRKLHTKAKESENTGKTSRDMNRPRTLTVLCCTRFLSLLSKSSPRRTVLRLLAADLLIESR